MAQDSVRAPLVRILLSFFVQSTYFGLGTSTLAQLFSRHPMSWRERRVCTQLGRVWEIIEFFKMGDEENYRTPSEQSIDKLISSFTAGLLHELSSFYLSKTSKRGTKSILAYLCSHRK